MEKRNPDAGEMAELLAQLRDVRTVPDAEVPKPAAKEPPKKVHTVRVGRETAGRRGKCVTTVFDLPLNEDAIKELAAMLKQKCGTGGTVKDGKIEIQGDHRDRIVAELVRLGYKVKPTGG
jgi:predicted translation initiation factor SUI1